MTRDIAAFTDRTFDVLIVGGGIYGAALAWESASRGYSVALVELGDFGGATSANSLKTIHGGIRYLQHLDVKRLRESARERTVLMRIAPHLVHPLPTLVPTYGRGLQGRAALKAASSAYDLLTLDRNRALDAAKHIPRGRLVSRKECLDLAPGIDRTGLTGGFVYHDAQVYNSERLVLAFLQTAASAGAVIANYVRVSELRIHRGAVVGARVIDDPSGNEFEIDARITVNAAGPWVDYVMEDQPPTLLALSFNIVTRPIFRDVAVGVTSRRDYRDPDVLVGRRSRLFFVAPWRGVSLVGTEYVPWERPVDELELDRALVEQFIEEVGAAIPGSNLSLDDLLFVHAGLIPMIGVHRQSGSVQVQKHPEIVDHAEFGRPGLFSVRGVKYTTARHVAERTIRSLEHAVMGRAKSSPTPHVPLHGGDIADFEAFMADSDTNARGLDRTTFQALKMNYGTRYTSVLDRCHEQHLSPRMLMRAEVSHAVDEEMAVHLEDVILRRTEIGSAGYPGDDVLRYCGEVMAESLGWSQAVLDSEVEMVRRRYPAFVRRPVVKPGRERS